MYKKNLPLIYVCIYVYWAERSYTNAKWKTKRESERDRMRKIIKNTKFYEQNMLIFSQPFQIAPAPATTTSKTVKINTEKSAQ